MEATTAPGPKESSAERRTAALCSAAAMLLGIAGLAGWAFEVPILIRIIPDYKAIAPSVAVSLVILGLVLLGLASGPVGRRERCLSAGAAGLISLVGLLELIGFLVGADLNREDLLTRRLAAASSIPFEPMSPVAGGLLFLVGTAMLALLLGPVADRTRRSMGDTACILGLVAAMIALIFGLGYVYGAPLLYGSSAIPISATGDLGGLLLAVGAVAAAGRDHWPLRTLVGDSARARLLRAFVPLTVFAALTISIADHRLAALEAPHHVLVGSMLAVAFALVAGLVASRVAQAIGGAIDEAQQAQRKAEQALAREARLLEAIAENTDAHLVYLDRDFNFIWVNSAYARACRHSKEEFAGHNHFEFYPHPENEAIFRRVRDTGEPARYIEKPFEFPDMPERGVTYWDWTLTPLKNARGEVENLIFSLADVTEKVRTREQVLEAERMRARLAETVALEINHRMKNNLMLVSGILELQISTQPAASDAAAALRQAKTRISALSTVHEQMYEQRSGRVEFSDVLKRISRIAVEALAAEGVNLSVSSDPVHIPSRAATTLAVVSNELVTNALKHGAPEPDGKKKVKVTLSHQNGKLQLRVWSSGNPLPADFDLEKPQGLGLHLCRELVVGELRGSFGVWSQEGGTMSEILVDDEALERRGGAA